MSDLSYFVIGRYFGNDESQNFFIFQPISKTFRMPTDDTVTITAWKSKRLSEEGIKPPAGPGNSLAIKLKFKNVSRY